MNAERQIQWIVAVGLFLIPIVSAAQAKYNGGSGTAEDPYQIATAEDLIALGERFEDYDKHFILTADIDLDPNLPGRKVFDKAVIAPDTNDATPWFEGAPFTGVFDGNGHKLRNYRGSDALFGSVAGTNSEITNLKLVAPEVSRPSVGGRPCLWLDAPPGSSLVAYLDGGVVSNCIVQDCNVLNKDFCLSVEGTGGLVGRNLGGTITNCHVSGQVSGRRHWVGGLVGNNHSNGTILYCSFSGSLTGATGGEAATGGLVGYNLGGISFCYSTGLVSGEGVGGLVGWNVGVISNCYSTSNVVAPQYGAAGLVNQNSGIVSNCYSTGAVSTSREWEPWTGGLVGFGGPSNVTASFWDTQTSGQATSAGGTGKTTAEMQTAKTFLDAGWGWDFAGETVNGTEDIWWIDEGQDYPRLICELPIPNDRAQEVSPSPILRWAPGAPGLQHDVYFGEDEAVVASATPASAGIYRGRQPGEIATYVPGKLAWRTTYYWRIDEVNQTDPDRVRKGQVWRFTITDFIVDRVPADGAIDVIQSEVLAWRPVEPGLQYDVYLGEAKDSVANATTASQGIYRGRQTSEATTYTPPALRWGTTYHWRIDAVDVADPNRVLKGEVWSFTVTDLIVAPDPLHNAIDVIQPVVLRWRHAGDCVLDDLYFGEDEEGVANATTETPGIYRGRQPSQGSSYDAGPLKWAKTYYWRIDGVDGADPNTIWKGRVWSFTTVDFIVAVVDDFEGYMDDRGHLISKTWIARGGSDVGNLFGPPYAEQRIVHGGRQSMPMEYWNDYEPWYSEAQRTWETPQDWTNNCVDALTLYFRGDAGNSQEQLYVAMEDSAGRMAVVAHPDPNAVLGTQTQWQKWHIPLADLRAAGVDPTAVKKLAIGVGDRNSPQPGGTGKIYIDDIRLTKRMP